MLYGTTATNGQLKIAWPAEGACKGDTEPGFTIDLAHKDLTLIVEAANAAKVPLAVGRGGARGVQFGAQPRLWRPGFFRHGRTCCATSPASPEPGSQRQSRKSEI